MSNRAPGNHKGHRNTPVRRLTGSLIASVGYILSPLSWWNDLVVNIPLAYAFAWPFALLHQRLFLPAFILGYWLTNLLGLLLLHHGVAGLLRPRQAAPRLRYHIVVAVLYTALIALLVWLQWIPAPDALMQMIDRTA